MFVASITYHALFAFLRILVPRASILLVSGGDRSLPLTKMIEALGTRMISTLVIWSRVFWSFVTWDLREAQRWSKSVSTWLSSVLPNLWLLLVTNRNSALIFVELTRVGFTWGSREKTWPVHRRCCFVFFFSFFSKTSASAREWARSINPLRFQYISSPALDGLWRKK